ncbi:hypothetical protein K0U73_02940, partial [bacterium]|nr:hypothetical protein [bacterium]
MTDLTTTDSDASRGGQQRAHPGPDFDPMLPTGAVPPRGGIDPLSPDFHDPNYDPEEWERLPRRTTFGFRLGVIALILLLGGAFLYSRANAWLDSQID